MGPGLVEEMIRVGAIALAMLIATATAVGVLIGALVF